MKLTVNATIAEERARKPYLAIPSDNPIKVFAIPNIILQSKIHTKTPPAPHKTMLFLLQNASICNPTACLYLENAFLTAAPGSLILLFNKFISNLPPRFELPVEMYLNPRKFLVKLVSTDSLWDGFWEIFETEEGNKLGKRHDGIHGFSLGFREMIWEMGVDEIGGLGSDKAFEWRWWRYLRRITLEDEGFDISVKLDSREHKLGRDQSNYITDQIKIGWSIAWPCLTRQRRCLVAYILCKPGFREEGVEHDCLTGTVHLYDVTFTGSE